MKLYIVNNKPIIYYMSSFFNKHPIYGWYPAKYVGNLEIKEATELEYLLYNELIDNFKKYIGL